VIKREGGGTLEGRRKGGKLILKKEGEAILKRKKVSEGLGKKRGSLISSWRESIFFPKKKRRGRAREGEEKGKGIFWKTDNGKRKRRKPHRLDDLRRKKRKKGRGSIARKGEPTSAGRGERSDAKEEKKKGEPTIFC